MVAQSFRGEIKLLAEGYSAGAAELLECDPIAIYCSRHIPLSILETAERVIGEIADECVLAGGWHSRLEKRLLRTAVQSPTSRIVYFLAKGIDRFRLPNMLRPLYAGGRLLVLSPFRTEPRITRSLVDERDAWMRTLVQRYLFCYIDPDGMTNILFHRCLDEAKEVYVLHHPENTPLAEQATAAISRYNYRGVLFP